MRRNKDFFGQNVKKLAIDEPMVAHHSILLILYVEIQTPEETNFIYTKKDRNDQKCKSAISLNSNIPISSPPPPITHNYIFTPRYRTIFQITIFPHKFTTIQQSKKNCIQHQIHHSQPNQSQVSIIDRYIQYV